MNTAQCAKVVVGTLEVQALPPHGIPDPPQKRCFGGPFVGGESSPIVVQYSASPRAFDVGMSPASSCGSARPTRVSITPLRP
ncbi:hypothetical protein [Mycobacterium riyadhense]|uniref:hypothetical protein n=1 Tax=Mycobacterium riyadhense TaxID=486698 RepID=UPI00111C3DD4|nr:hypothetical protein [Mycobacterium riyadhense]